MLKHLKTCLEPSRFTKENQWWTLNFDQNFFKIQWPNAFKDVTPYKNEKQDRKQEFYLLIITQNLKSCLNKACRFTKKSMLVIES